MWTRGPTAPPPGQGSPLGDLEEMQSTLEAVGGAGGTGAGGRTQRLSRDGSQETWSATIEAPVITPEDQGAIRDEGVRPEGRGPESGRPPLISSMGHVGRWFVLEERGIVTWCIVSLPW